MLAPPLYSTRPGPRGVDTFQKVGGLESKMRAHRKLSCEHAHIGDKRSTTAGYLDDKIIICSILFQEMKVEYNNIRAICVLRYIYTTATSLPRTHAASSARPAPRLFSVGLRQATLEIVPSYSC